MEPNGENKFFNHLSDAGASHQLPTYLLQLVNMSRLEVANANKGSLYKPEVICVDSQTVSTIHCDLTIVRIYIQKGRVGLDLIHNEISTCAFGISSSWDTNAPQCRWTPSILWVSVLLLARWLIN